MHKIQKQIVIAVSIMMLVGLSINAYANVYGGHFDESVTTSKVSSLTSDKNGQTVTLEGVISALCKGDGCWLNLKPYDFRIPKDSSGKKAQIQGKVKASDQRVSVDAISIKVLE